jgi:hypothetical protein
MVTIVDHMKIENPNSSGQGYCIVHGSNLYHHLITLLGFSYSHTTRIGKGYQESEPYAHHTYTRMIGGKPLYLSVSYKRAYWGLECSFDSNGRRTVVCNLQPNRIIHPGDSEYRKITTYVKRRVRDLQKRYAGVETYDVELTDTYGGEANYSWVRREVIQVPGGSSRTQIVRKAKSAIGITGRCLRTEWEDTIELRPSGSCIVCFITYKERESPIAGVQSVAN